MAYNGSRGGYSRGGYGGRGGFNGGRGGYNSGNRNFDNNRNYDNARDYAQKDYKSGNSGAPTELMLGYCEVMAIKSMCDMWCYFTNTLRA